MWRVVLDGVSLTSALLDPHGSPARLLDFALGNRLRLFATPRMVAAVGRALRADALKQRHGLSDRELSLLIADLPVLLCMVSGTTRATRGGSLHADVLDCAIQSHADFLVASRPMNATAVEHGGTQVVTADQLAKLVGRNL